MGSLSGKVALITGSSRGIGAAIARLFAQQGAKVVVHGRDLAALSAVRSDIERSGGTTMHVVGDVTKFSDIEAMRLRIEQELGPVDVLVANAGGSATASGALEEISEEAWRASVDGNLTATFLKTRTLKEAFAPCWYSSNSKGGATGSLSTQSRCRRRIAENGDCQAELARRAVH